MFHKLSFKWKRKSIACIFHILHIHSSLDGHLGYFHFGAWKKLCVMLLWTFVLKFLCEHVFSSLLLDHMLNPCLTIWGAARQFSKVAAQFYSPDSNVWGFQLLTSSPALVISCRLYCSYPSGCSYITLWFWFAFPWD